MSFPIDAGMQVVPDNNKQITLGTEGLEMVANEISFAPDVHSYNASVHPYNASVHPYNASVHHPIKRKKFQVIGLLALVVTLAAVLGGVLGSRAASAERHLNSLATPSTSRPAQRSIAALSFTTKAENNTRVYFQDNEGQILEAANSASNHTWKISKTGCFGRNGSALAAAVSPPGFPLAGELIYFTALSLRSL